MEGENVIWIEERAGRLMTAIPSVMAKIGIQTERSKGNFLFSVLCAGFVLKDDLI